MDFFFADDSIQRNPSRQGMSRLVAAGGIYVPSANINPLERRLSEICADVQFPPGEEFKWSPGREDWMHDALVGTAREAFFADILHACTDANVRTVVTISDTDSNHPTSSRSHEDFVIQMLIERIERLAVRAGCDVVIVFDRPGGAQAQEDNFLARCLETIQEGTPYVRPARIALNALSTSSHFVRLLQVADLVTGCVTAFVGGEGRFAPQTIRVIRPLLARNVGRVGGCGVKIHPDFRYVNLYHWLFFDTEFWRWNVGHVLPLAQNPYARSGKCYRV